MQEVSEFIVIAPAAMGKAIERVEARLIEHLARAFPHYKFQIEAYGPFADEEDFSIVPIMNRRPEPGERADPGQMFMCAPLDPRVIPQISAALRLFEKSARLH